MFKSKEAENVNQALLEGKMDQAFEQLQQMIAANPKDDEAHYLMGNYYRKIGETRLSMNSYLAAIDINPESPAQFAYDHMIKVLDFYNKDMYNQ